MEPVLFSWSSGKDSALALHELLKDGRYEVVALLTTLSQAYDRVSMHGVRRALVEDQARSIGLPLEAVVLPASVTTEAYEDAMRRVLAGYQARGVRKVAFGDIHLEDVRRYREANLARGGMEGIFPLWGRETTALIRDVIRAGFAATVTCVDGQALDASFVGRLVDEVFVASLPQGVDPCGENGEFHTFVHAGPVFRTPVRFAHGGTVLRDERFWYRDLLPEG